MTAPASATTGAYGELDPRASTSGASRPPSTAPAAIPTSESPLQTNPCAAPPRAASQDEPDREPVHERH